MIFLGNTNTVVDVRKGLEPIQKIMNGSTEIFNGIPIEQQYVYRQSAGNGVCYIRTLEGKSLVWNQLVQNGNFADGTTGWSSAPGDSISVNNGVLTLEKQNTAGIGAIADSAYTGIANHKYFISAFLCAVDGVSTGIGFRENSGALGGNTLVSTTSTSVTRVAGIVTCVDTGDMFHIRVGVSASPAGIKGTAENVFIVDLTLMFGEGKEPSTVAEFEALYNELYYPYRPGVIKNNDAVAIETVGFNQWDEEWEVGSIDVTNGNNVVDSTAIRSKNYIPVLPNTVYFFTYSQAKVRLYDANKNYLGYPSSFAGGVFTTPANCTYIRFATQPTYGATYNNDICINLSDPARNGTYEPYWKKSIQLGLNAFRVTDGTNIITVNGLKSAGSVYDEIDPVRKKYIKRIGEVDLGTMTWEYIATYPIFTVSLSTLRAGQQNSICSAYDNPYNSSLSDMRDKTLTTREALNVHNIIVKDTAYTDAAAFKAAMSGVMLNFELATPVEYDLVDDIPNAIEVDENGTERAIFPVHLDGAPSAPFRCQSNYYLTPANVED